MSQEEAEDKQSGGVSIGDIYYVLFRHKWMIIVLSLLGLIGSAVLFLIRPPRFRSTASLYIGYVTQSAPLLPPGADGSTKMLGDQGPSIINTETKILLSLNVAREAVTNVGAERILAKLSGGTNIDQAAQAVQGSLEIELPPNTQLINVTYQHPDETIVKEVLNQIILAYIHQHNLLHKPMAVYGDFLVQETERLQNDLDVTQKTLNEALTNAGVSQIEEAKKDLADQISKKREEIFSAQAEYEEHKATLEALPKQVTTVSNTFNATNTLSAIPPEFVGNYNDVCATLALLNKQKTDLLTQFTSANPLVVDKIEQIAETQQQKRALEGKYPALLQIPTSVSLLGQPTPPSMDPIMEAVQVRSIGSRIKVLNSQMELLKSEADRVTQWEPKVLELQRKRDLDESNLTYFKKAMDQARVDRELGAGKAPGINVMQSPTPPVKEWSKSFKKKVQMVAMGGIGLGIGLAFLIELFLDRTVKRPGDVEKKLNLPLFISIPYLSRNGREELANYSLAGNHRLLSDAKVEGKTNGHSTKPRPQQGLMKPLAKWDRIHPLRRYFEGLRDRLIVYFEVRNAAQKPKLVGVTSCNRGVGVTTTANGLAATLSETGDGKVLLVDLHSEQGASQQFFKGQPAGGLDETLGGEGVRGIPVQPKLDVPVERAKDEKMPMVLANQFDNLMPKLNASDYDYIVFDMPPITQTSVTPRMARIMDMILLVVESEKTNQDMVKQATALLAESKAHVSTVLNKIRTYVPTRLHKDVLDDV